MAHMTMVSQWAVMPVTRLTTHQLLLIWSWNHGTHAWYKHVPQLAGVTKSLTKKEWSNDPRALEALKQEAVELRSNLTWDDDTVAPLYQIRNWARSAGAHIKVAELLTLVGIKHHELEPSQWKWKGRIVYRGDQVRDQDNNLLLFDQTATTPTSLIALNAAIWYACRKGHAASCSDAIQAVGT